MPTAKFTEQTPSNGVTVKQMISLPSFYFNGFQISLTGSDMSLVGICDGQPISKMNMSFTTGKTLMLALKDAIELLEKTTDQELMTTEFVQGKIAQNQKDNS